MKDVLWNLHILVLVAFKHRKRRKNARSHAADVFFFSDDIDPQVT